MSVIQHSCSDDIPGSVRTIPSARVQSFWLCASVIIQKSSLDTAQTLHGQSMFYHITIFSVWIICPNFKIYPLPFYIKQLDAMLTVMLQRHLSFICWWFSYDVIKNMIYFPQIFVYLVRPYGVSLYQI